MRGLTPKQSEVLDFIEQHLAKKAYAPSYRTIQHHFGYRSVGTVYNLVQALKKKGHLVGERGAHNSLKVTSQHTHSAADIELTLIGTLCAGEPIATYNQSQTIAVPAAMVPSPDRTYVLRAKGNRLLDEGIADGDLLIVEGRQEAEDGETIVALLDKRKAWIKRYSLRGEGVLLKSHHESAEPLLLPQSQVQVMGIVLGLLRIY